MSPHLFNFNLRPLEEILPWGAPEAPYLHWFGLTDGEYWIDAGGNRLFEYSEFVRAKFGWTQFCDYQVVRLYEDMLDLAPFALEPVPVQLRRYIAVDRSRVWSQDWKQWCGALDELLESEHACDLLDGAGPWMGSRTLDSGYLNPSANVIFWSDAESVHIEWDNREKLVEGSPAWTAELGQWTLTRREFINEVLSFHDRLMTQMAERVAQIAAGALTASIRIDLDTLLREQEKRAQVIDHTFFSLSNPTNWESVEYAITALTELSQRNALRNP